jgi:hypothetical protein
MSTIRGFWQHANGRLYAIESDTFGNIIGGVGPLNPDELRNLDDYEYTGSIVGWLQDSVAQRKLRRVNPAFYRSIR